MSESSAARVPSTTWRISLGLARHPPHLDLTSQAVKRECIALAEHMRPDRELLGVLVHLDSGSSHD